MDNTSKSYESKSSPLRLPGSEFYIVCVVVQDLATRLNSKLIEFFFFSPLTL